MRLHDLAQSRGVGEQEIGRRKGVGQHAREKLHAAFGQGLDTFDAADQIVQPVRRNQIRLLDNVEDRVGGPVGIVEALVALARLGDGRGGLARRGLRGGAPQLHISAKQVGLRAHQPIRLRGQTPHHFPQGRADVQGVGRQGGGRLGLAQGRFGYGALGGEGRAGEIERQGLQRLALVAGE